MTSVCSIVRDVSVLVDAAGPAGRTRLHSSVGDFSQTGPLKLQKKMCRMENCIINYIWHPVRSFLLILGTDWDSSDFKTSNSYNETHILAPSPLVRLRNDLRRWRERVAREGAQMRLICGTKFTSGQRIYVSQSPRMNSMLSTLANSVLDCGGT